MGGAFRVTEGLHARFGDRPGHRHADGRDRDRRRRHRPRHRRHAADRRAAVRRLHLLRLRPARHRGGQAPLPLRRRRADRRAGALGRRRRRRAVPLAEPRGRSSPTCPASRSCAPATCRTPTTCCGPPCRPEPGALLRAQGPLPLAARAARAAGAARSRSARPRSGAAGRRRHRRDLRRDAAALPRRAPSELAARGHRGRGRRPAHRVPRRPRHRRRVGRAHRPPRRRPRGHRSRPASAPRSPPAWPSEHFFDLDAPIAPGHRARHAGAVRPPARGCLRPDGRRASPTAIRRHGDADARPSAHRPSRSTSRPPTAGWSLARAMEERLRSAYTQGRLRGRFLSGRGQEAIPVGAALVPRARRRHGAGAPRPRRPPRARHHAAHDLPPLPRPGHRPVRGSRRRPPHGRVVARACSRWCRTCPTRGP